MILLFFVCNGCKRWCCGVCLLPALKEITTTVHSCFRFLSCQVQGWFPVSLGWAPLLCWSHWVALKLPSFHCCLFSFCSSSSELEFVHNTSKMGRKNSFLNRWNFINFTLFFSCVIGSCRDCLTRIPYATFIATVLCFIGIGVFCGTVYRGATLANLILLDVFHVQVEWYISYKQQSHTLNCWLICIILGLVLWD